MNQKRIVFASSNPGKLRELLAVLGPLGIEVVALPAEALEPEPVEDADTFEGNARIKAREYARRTGSICLAEDSGLEVDALGGAPGVHSARYAGVSGNREARDLANNEKLLRELECCGDCSRAARFVAAMCLAAPDGTIICETRGTFSGEIARHAAGRGGFGYDPLLYLPDQGCTSAELSPEAKNARSHRGEAARKLAELLVKETLSGQ